MINFKKIFLLIIIFIVIFCIIPFSVFAEETKLHTNINFNETGGIIDTEGINWEILPYDDDGDIDIDFIGDRANIKKGMLFINYNNMKGFFDDLYNDKDFAIESNFSLNGLTENDAYLIYAIATTDCTLYLLYDPRYNKFNYTIFDSINEDYYTGKFTVDSIFSEGVDKMVQFGRFGDKLILNVDGVFAEPILIPDKLKFGGVGGLSIGLNSNSNPNVYMSLTNLKILTNPISEPIDPVEPVEPVIPPEVEPEIPPVVEPIVTEKSKGITLNVVGGVLDINLGDLTFNPILFKSSEVQKTIGSSLLTILDERTNGAGWSVKVKSTDFTRIVRDPSGGSGDITIKFPSNNLKLIPDEVKVLSGQLLDDIYGPYTQNLTLGNLSQDIITSKPGFGMGKYELLLNYELTIPKKVEITNISGVGSKYKLGDEIGIMEGTYNATITYTIGSGL